jgi:hypothetical protein
VVDALTLADQAVGSQAALLRDAVENYCAEAEEADAAGFGSRLTVPPTDEKPPQRGGSSNDHNRG